MKVTKSQATMYILKLLLENGSISKEEITDVIELSNLSFLRYIQEIRAFLYNFNINLEVKYSRDEGKYYLVKTDSNDFIY